MLQTSPSRMRNRLDFTWDHVPAPCLPTPVPSLLSYTFCSEDTPPLTHRYLNPCLSFWGLRHTLSLLFLLSHLVLSDSFVTPWTVSHQAPLPMGFPRQESWGGLPFPSPEIFPGIEPTSLALQVDSLPRSHQIYTGWHWYSVWSSTENFKFGSSISIP